MRSSLLMDAMIQVTVAVGRTLEANKLIQHNLTGIIELF